MSVIYRYPSYYKIPQVYKIPSEIKNSLSKWNAAYFRLESIGYYYNEKTKELRIPRGYPEDSLQNLFDREIVDGDVERFDKIDIDLQNAPKDYIQEKVLAFMVGEDEFYKNQRATQLYVDLDTGRGKTYLGIVMGAYYKSRVVVVTPPIAKVEDQWKESVNNFTSLNRSECLVVSGSSMCADIVKGKYENVKFFIIPTSTILAFVKKYEDNWEMVTELFNAMHCNIKIIDEAHMAFNTNVNIDCFTNNPKTYYMSSTPSRSDVAEKKIYARVFHNVPRFGKKILTKEQKHIIPLIMQFKSTPTMEQVKAIKTKYGPSPAKYGDYLLDPEGARDEFLDAYLYSLYFLLKLRRNAGKILVICITVEFAKELQKYTDSIFPYLTTGLFVGSGKDKNEELKRDIVFSTIKSMGTGSEMPNHQSTINTITYASDVLADQICGRIREQPDGRKGVYIEIVNTAHPIARSHFDSREKILIRKAKNATIHYHQISDDDITKVAKFLKSGYEFTENGNISDKDGHIVMHRLRKSSR